MVRAATLLVASLLVALPATAAAQEPPACAPDKTMDAKLSAQESEEFKRMVASHEVVLTAEIHDLDAPVSRSPDHIVIAPEPGVQVTGKYAGGSDISIFAPSTPTLTAVVSWRQTTDPDNYDVTDKCSASRTFTLPVTAANPARGAKQPNPGPDNGDYTFAIAAAEAKYADLRPLVVSIRSTAHRRLPRANERLKTWTIPMRSAEQLKYRGRLPNAAYATTPQMCRYWWLACGPAFARVSALNVNDKALNRGLVLPDLDGSNSILMGLAYSQPQRWAASNGIVISANPGVASPQLFGYDIQVTQAGRLLARVRRVGRCVEERRRAGLFHACKLTRSTTLLR
jgi:hypothetical protein